MQFKKVDVLISENLTKEQLKEKVLTELNKISRASNPSISYIANIHDIFNGKYWICMDSETKETMGAADELIDLQSNLINAHTADFNNPHRTTVSNLTDTTITNPQRNQALVYDGTKWVNKNVALDGSNYAKKNEANIFTKKQSGIDGTEDANFVTLRQLKTKVGLTGNETIAGVKTFSVPPVSATNPTANNQVANKSYVDTVGNSKVALSGNQTIAGVKTFSSSIVIPNATANNHSLPLGQADNRYSTLLTQNLEWTVGTGGKFTKISDALNEALKYNPAKIGHVSYPVVLTLKDGFIINEQIECVGINLGFVIIKTETPGAEVIVENSALQKDIGSFKTAFYASNNGVLPTLSFKCKLRTPNEKNTAGFALRYGGKIILGSASEFSDFDIGCYLGESSNSSIISSSYKRNNIGIKCWKSFVDASYVTIDGSKTNSVEARNCLLMMERAKLLNQTKGTSVINCSFGATVSATGSNTSGSTVPFGNIANNQITSNGLIVF